MAEKNKTAVNLPPCGPCGQDNHERCLRWYINNLVPCPCYTANPEIHQHQTA